MSISKNPPHLLPADFYAIKYSYADFEVSRRTVYYLIAQGILPKPTRWHQHFVGWPKADVIHILESRYAFRVEK